MIESTRKVHRLHVMMTDRQRRYVGARATAEGKSLAGIIRDLINDEIARTGAVDANQKGKVQ